MDCRANSDLFFLHEEKFDFDMSMSPASSNGDEDEVFVEPVGRNERCVSVNVKTQLDGRQLRTSWSPLTGDQLEAVCQEAHKLASQLQSGERSQSHSEDDKDNEATAAVTTQPDEFVQDSQAKLHVFEQSNRVLSPIKRETFCVQESPLKQLPPAIQQRLLRGSSNTSIVSSLRSASAPLSTRPASAHPKSVVKPACVTRLSTSSPVTRARSQPKAGLRGKAPLGAVLPSKPAAPVASTSTTKSRVEKNRLQPPSRTVIGRRCSPPRRTESSEELLSDSASVASDISDSSINSSLLGKRNLAPRAKVVVAVFKVISMRKLNSSMNRSVSSSTGPAPGSDGRPMNPSRARRSTINAAAGPASSVAGRRSLSTQAKKATPLKRAEFTPTKRVLEKSGSISATSTTLPQGGLRTKSKPEALVLITPSAGVRGPNHGDKSKMLKPKRLESVISMDSLPQKSSAGPLTPSAGTYKPLQFKTGRPSSLPTPVRRKPCTFPVSTPTNPPKLTKPPLESEADLPPESNSGDNEPSCSPSSTVALELEPDDPSIEPDDPSIEPFCLEEEEELPVVTSSGPPEPDQSESAESGGTHKELEHESEARNLIELETANESNHKAHEPQEKLLIDLTNTPNLIRTSNKSCTGTQVTSSLAFQQLIDLSSPLIKWSPENKSENTAPLINLSF
uniref:G-2 and S-phase expressed 1 n=1 Tax=Takifugu rubripes TaxID=31033 RepID=Q8UW50_TAKRU|nr:G-2 and S-phase expressed 1 [Takifugu rubripes]